jgi:hypothetical protein
MEAEPFWYDLLWKQNRSGTVCYGKQNRSGTVCYGNRPVLVRFAMETDPFWYDLLWKQNRSGVSGLPIYISCPFFAESLGCHTATMQALRQPHRWDALLVRISAGR